MSADNVEPELAPEVSKTLEQPEDPGTTWDGKPISPELPHGCSVVVYRRGAGTGGVEVLLLHRAHNGPEYEGDWAWTPPSGARFPGEPVLDCARRELHEEAGLELEIDPRQCGSERWHVYVAEAPASALVTLEHDPEHDRFAWLSPEDALERCRPDAVRDGLVAALLVIERKLRDA